MDDKGKLARLDDLVIAEILATPDHEIIARADLAEVEVVRAEIAAARTRAGKDRMAKAKVALALAHARPKVVPLDHARGAAALSAARVSDRDLDRKLTLAARSGGPDYEADRPGIEEDLAELDAWEDEDKDGS